MAPTRKKQNTQQRAQLVRPACRTTHSEENDSENSSESKHTLPVLLLSFKIEEQRNLHEHKCFRRYILSSILLAHLSSDK